MQSSSLLTDSYVLSDQEVCAIAELLDVLEDDYPVDAVAQGREIVLDSEWKVLGDGRLIIKQIRPFLRHE